jgi:hypothetical protein
VLIDSAHPDSVFDSAGGRWVTYCESHGRICNHATFALAREFLPWPANWCEVCSGVEAEEMSDGM